jgi:hypothetical protein
VSNFVFCAGWDRSILAPAMVTWRLIEQRLSTCVPVHLCACMHECICEFECMYECKCGVTVVSQWCHSGVTVVSQWCHSGPISFWVHSPHTHTHTHTHHTHTHTNIKNYTRTHTWTHTRTYPYAPLGSGRWQVHGMQKGGCRDRSGITAVSQWCHNFLCTPTTHTHTHTHTHRH